HGVWMTVTLQTHVPQQAGFVHQRNVVLRVWLAARRRYPVFTVLGKKRAPLVPAFLVDQSRFVKQEVLEVPEGWLFCHGATLRSPRPRSCNPATPGTGFGTPCRCFRSPSGRLPRSAPPRRHSARSTPSHRPATPGRAAADGRPRDRPVRRGWPTS